jgi:hypothetical protein
MRSLPIGRIALSGAIALLALVSSAFPDADGGSAGNRDTIHLDGSGTAPWCVPTDASPSGRSCRYVTFEQCLTAVTGQWQICRPNPAGVVTTDEGPYRTYRPIYL